MKLEGVKVLDLSLFLPGPMLTLMMADHGADVIKVEPWEEGDPARHIGYRKNGHTVWFRNANRGKRSLRLNLKADADKARFMALAAEADVVVEAFRPGVADRLGVGYNAIAAINPGVVYVSISAFGQTGPNRDRPAHDLAVEALAGVVALNEGQDGKPAMPHMPVADALASLTALSGVLMALLRRRDTGKGDFLDVAMFDSLIAWTPNVTGRIFATGEPHVVKDERSFGGNAMYNLYETADHQWVSLGGAEPKFAKALLSGLGREDLTVYATYPPGPQQEPLRAFLREAFKQKTRTEWETWFEGRDVCFAPVRNLKEAFEDPHLVARGMLAHDAEGSEIVGTPLIFRDEPGRPDPTVPPVNDDTLGWR
ncbi:CaiB/BaiF CoA-transferase family protein [Caulobacter sp. BP25]|uniref:CaiB/BaiF CoA transferase family protein n=1 Tax=Caulobacter sp. BP25 TaxID=2048900 RepID=UPI000C12A01D|nr:CoA transferase [Caulobacter sp. BP25]PHY20129.1 CoA transferase [Caulobacter sp. BP25]